MGLGTLGNALDILSSVFAMGGGTLHRQVILQGQLDSLVLPVTPREYTVTSGQKNKVVDITQLGEALVFGMPKLRTLSFSCFLPALQHDYPFIVGDSKAPSECIELINKWKEARLPVRVIITDTPVNLMFGIMSFDYKEQDGSRDIYYTLSLTEYKNLNTPMANNDKQVDDTTGLKARPTDVTQPTTATIWQQGADICDAAKKAYGDYNHWRRIVQSNDLKDLAINNASKLRKLVVK
ncbi:hypothetical protein [uncultured Megasphaera sp.]|uniref:hypothetical protein n=1 Tax=uncultured Megasphaera sp. TaxID=165188 RepID=UPI00265B220A|nr:hypothetical protein [uncultured Megasphaera sp.]